MRCEIIAPLVVTDTDRKARTFSGLASAWEAPEDPTAPRLVYGACARTLEHWKRSKSPRTIPLFDGTSRIGNLQAAKETRDGLIVTFAIVLLAADSVLSRVQLFSGKRSQLRLSIQCDSIGQRGSELLEVRLSRFVLSIEHVIAHDDPERVALESRLDSLKRRAFAQ